MGSLREQRGALSAFAKNDDPTRIVVPSDKLERRISLRVMPAAKKFTTPRCRAKQNHLFRTNRAHRIPPQSFSVASLGLRASKLSKSRNFNTSANRLRNSRRINTSVFQDLKLPGMNTYQKWPRGGRPPDPKSASRPFASRLESYSCTRKRTNSHRMIFLQKIPGGGVHISTFTLTILSGCRPLRMAHKRLRPLPEKIAPHR